MGLKRLNLFSDFCFCVVNECSLCLCSAALNTGATLRQSAHQQHTMNREPVCWEGVNDIREDTLYSFTLLMQMSGRCYWQNILIQNNKQCFWFHVFKPLKCLFSCIIMKWKPVLCDHSDTIVAESNEGIKLNSSIWGKQASCVWLTTRTLCQQKTWPFF